MKTAITNVKVFSQGGLSEPKTIVIENGLISEKTEGDLVIDGSGCTLLPGLIDAHTHVDVIEHLEMAAKAGVTTLFEMANHSPAVVDSLRNCEGVSSLIGSCYPATAGQKMGFVESAIVTSAEDSERYVKEVIELGADFIKIIIEDDKEGNRGFTIKEVAAIVEAAHQYGKITVAHVTTPQSYATGVEAGVDILTHIPIGAVIPQPIIDKMVEQNTVDIPTMTMMEGIVGRVKKMNPGAPIDFDYVTISVGKMHAAGVTILAGTDANDQSQAPYQTPHGESLHHELELLIEAGLTPKEALISATSLPAEVFGLKDRGVIEVGRRADLLLVEGDPTVDIRATRAIKGVWIGGVKVDSIGGKSI